MTEKAGKDTVARPSDTLMTMFEYVPTWAVAGVPVSAPVAVLNVPQAGLLVIEKDRVLPSASLAVGVKL